MLIAKRQRFSKKVFLVFIFVITVKFFSGVFLPPGSDTSSQKIRLQNGIVDTKNDRDFKPFHMANKDDLEYFHLNNAGADANYEKIEKEEINQELEKLINDLNNDDGVQKEKDDTLDKNLNDNAAGYEVGKDKDELAEPNMAWHYNDNVDHDNNNDMDMENVIEYKEKEDAKVDKKGHKISIDNTQDDDEDEENESEEEEKSAAKKKHKKVVDLQEEEEKEEDAADKKLSKGKGKAGSGEDQKAIVDNEESEDWKNNIHPQEEEEDVNDEKEVDKIGNKKLLPAGKDDLKVDSLKELADEELSEKSHKKSEEIEEEQEDVISKEKLHPKVKAGHAGKIKASDEDDANSVEDEKAVPKSKLSKSDKSKEMNVEEAVIDSVDGDDGVRHVKPKISIDNTLDEDEDTDTEAEDKEVAVVKKSKAAAKADESSDDKSGGLRGKSGKKLSHKVAKSGHDDDDDDVVEKAKAVKGEEDEENEEHEDDDAAVKDGKARGKAVDGEKEDEIEADDQSDVKQYHPKALKIEAEDDTMANQEKKMKSKMGKKIDDQIKIHNKDSDKEMDVEEALDGQVKSKLSFKKQDVDNIDPNVEQEKKKKVKNVAAKKAQKRDKKESEDSGKLLKNIDRKIEKKFIKSDEAKKLIKGS